MCGFLMVGVPERNPYLLKDSTRGEPMKVTPTTASVPILLLPLRPQRVSRDQTFQM